MKNVEKPIISLVVAIDSKGGIGKNNKIPWYLPEDIKRFKDLTMGHPVIMGRKTFESILSTLKKPLPGRTNIVVTRNPDFNFDGVLVLNNIEDAIKKGKEIDSTEVFVAGGSQIFDEVADTADRLYLTVIEGDFDADTFFNKAELFKKVVYKEKKQEGNYSYTFLTLEK